MSIYTVFEVKNGEALFTTFTKKKDLIPHPKIKEFKIQKEIDCIKISGKDYVKSMLSTDTNEIIDEINFDMIIARHNIIYCIVCLQGRGIMTVHGYVKYIRDNIFGSVEKYLKEKYNLDIKIERFKFDNDHFSKDYWGEKVTTEMSYYSSDQLHIRISCKNFFQFIQNNPNLNKYFIDGTIKAVKGYKQDFEYPVDGSKQLGSFKFDRQGQFHLEFSDIDFFNNYVKKMIDRNFFRRDEP
jgi:hypothetical protein